MLPDPGTIVTIVGMAIAGIVAFVKLQGQVNSHEKECVVWRKRADERHAELKADMKDGFGEVNEKLDRVIERVR